MDLAEKGKTHELLHQTKSIFCIIIKPFWYKYQQIQHATAIHHINRHLHILLNFSFYVGDPCDRVCILLLIPVVNSPVCGSDGITYSTTCALVVAGCKQGEIIRVLHQGPCRGKTNTSIAIHTNSNNKFKINKINNVVLQLYECACVSNLPQELF